MTCISLHVLHVFQLSSSMKMQEPFPLQCFLHGVKVFTVEKTSYKNLENREKLHVPNRPPYRGDLEDIDLP